MQLHLPRTWSPGQEPDSSRSCLPLEVVEFVPENGRKKSKPVLISDCLISFRLRLGRRGVVFIGKEREERDKMKTDLMWVTKLFLLNLVAYWCAFF